MHVVTVTFVTAPERRDAFADAMNTQAQNSLEREPACLKFDVCRNPDDPDTTFLYEIYEDGAAFQDHLASDHFKEFDALVTDWVVSKTVNTWDLVYPGA